MLEKERLLQKFSSDPDRYYKVALFEEEGFKRKRCPSCGKFFWTLDAEREHCPDQPCQDYTFLGDTPTKRRFDYVRAWKEIERFFVENGHYSIPRYPVVCRWRPDLFFTVASIIDFQRIEGGKLIFDLPQNPLIVPQMCLRFNDVENVGVTGKHYTSFCMFGQTALSDGQGYWKDRCIELDYRLMVERFGIPKEEIVFVEDVWLGYGAFGYSLEYFVRGLELGNAVFTAFEGTPQEYREMAKKVIDMGGGLERFTWITWGTPTSYDCVFEPVLKRMLQATKVEVEEGLKMRYFRLAGRLGVEEGDVASLKAKIAQQLGLEPRQLLRQISAVEALYALADHVRTLTFAIADGAIPSNVGGGYNLRVILRRSLGFLDRFGWDLRLEEVADWHIEQLRGMYPELEEHRDEVAKILDVERGRYLSTKARVDKIIESIRKKKKALSVDELITLYDSEGITPELLKAKGLSIDIPQDFYARVTARHSHPKPTAERPRFDVEGLPPTRLLFYEDRDRLHFQATVLKVFDGRFVVLDQTAFYARAGGQEHDKGILGGKEVVNVEKLGEVVIHELKEPGPKEGEKVEGLVDAKRRSILMRHHTATHIVNGAAREVLGSWVWQHSAYKDIDLARLDITHYAHLSREELQKIEDLANEVVRRNLEVSIEWLPRGEAEKRYGFTIYQGGIAPTSQIRIVNISGFDIEACGGTHCSRTGDVGFIKLLKSERVQDGIERLTFVAGEPALHYIRRQEEMVQSAAQVIGAQQERLVEAITNLKDQLDELKRGQRLLIRRLSGTLADEIIKGAKEIDGIKLHFSSEEGLDEEFHIMLGESAINKEPDLLYIALIPKGGKARLIAFAGQGAQAKGIRAGDVVREVAQIVGGGGGGDARFAQGGGGRADRITEVRRSLERIIGSLLIGDGR